MRLWSRLDRYIARQLQGGYALALAGFTAVFLLNFLFTLARQTIEKRVPFRLVVGFVLVEMPEILLTTMPMAAVIAVLVVVGRLSVQHELVALRAAGVSRVRVFRPVLVLAIVGALLSGLIAHVIQPMSHLHRRSLVEEIIRARDLSREIDPGVFYQRLADSVLYAATVSESPEGRVFERVLLYRESPRGDEATLVLSKRGQADFDRDTGRIYLRLDDGEFHSWEPSRPEIHQVTRFPNLTITFPPDPAFRVTTEGSRWDPQEFAGLDLRREVLALRTEREGATRAGTRIAIDKKLHKAQVEWHRRIALPVAIVVLSIAAFPMAFRSQRGGRFGGLTQGVLVIVVFSFLFVTGQGFANEEAWPPWLGMWLANGVAAVWAALIWWLSSGAEDRRGSRWALLAGLLKDRRSRRARAVSPVSAARPTESPKSSTRMLGIARVDRYLGAGFLKMFFTVLLVLVALVIGLEFQRIVGDMADSFASFPWSEVAAYLALTLPEQFAMLIPIAALAAAGISLSGLARAGEITALKASGIGPIRIAAPVLVITAVVCLFYGLAQETIVPAAAREARLLRDHLRGRSSAGVMDTGRRWIVGEDGRLWAYLDWDERAGAILAPGLFAVDLEEARLLERVEASEAIRSGQSWDFRNGWRRSFADDTGGDFERFEGFVSRAREDAEIFGANRDRLIFGRALADQLTIKDLWAHVDRMSRAGYDASALRVSLYQKFVTPLVAVALLLVGVPLVVSGWARKGSLFGLGVSLLITTAFWALWAVSTSLGREGVLSPPLAAFLPIVLLASAGVTLLGRAR